MNAIFKDKLNIINQELQILNMEQKFMNQNLDNINKIYDKLLFKSEPKGSSLNAAKFLKKL